MLDDAVLGKDREWNFHKGFTYDVPLDIAYKLVRNNKAMFDRTTGPTEVKTC